MMKYKCSWSAENMIQIGRFEPSSKTCSRCHSIKPNLKLSDRIYECEHCGKVIDRYINAAINIKQFGLKPYMEVVGTTTTISVLLSRALPKQVT